MSMTANNYVVYKKGETPDPKNGVFLLRALGEVLKGFETSPDWELMDCTSGKAVGKEAEPILRAMVIQQLVGAGHTKSLEIKDDKGNIKSINNIKDALNEVKNSKNSGIFYSGIDKYWVIKPENQNPNFTDEVDTALDMFNVSIPVEPFPGSNPPGTAEPTGSGSGSTPLPQFQPDANYKAEPVEDDMGIIPGVSGDQMMQMTTNFIKRVGKVKGGLAVTGAVLFLGAYKMMGVKGVIGMVLLVLALKRYMLMGAKAFQDQQLDLVARGLRDRIPVDANGTIDPAFMTALRHLPPGDHQFARRTISESIEQRPWPNNPIRQDPTKIRVIEDTVKQVVDGDTLYAGGIDGAVERFRFVGIDAPEIDHGNGSQPGAQKAWDRVKELCPPGTKVRLEVVENQPHEHERLPVYVYTKDSNGEEICVNEVLLREGLARITDFSPYHPKMEQFVQANLDAISTSTGLWNSIYNKAVTEPVPLVTIKPTTTGGKPSFGIS